MSFPGRSGGLLLETHILQTAAFGGLRVGRVIYFGVAIKKGTFQVVSFWIP